MKYRSSKRAMALAITEETRQKVWCRDAGRCVYCRRPGNPEAHYIPRSKGGLGVPENILTLCRSCHDRFDNGDRHTREGMREYFREYLQSQYADWSEDALVYKKWR